MVQTLLSQQGTGMIRWRKMFWDDQKGVQPFRTLSVIALPRLLQHLLLPMATATDNTAHYWSVYTRSLIQTRYHQSCLNKIPQNSALHIQKLWLTAGKRFPLSQPLVEVKELPSRSHSSRIILLSPKSC